jgi:hypothetical protein
MMIFRHPIVVATLETRNPAPPPVLPLVTFLRRPALDHPVTVKKEIAMNTRKKRPFLVAAVAVLCLAGSGISWADGGHYRQDRHGYGFHSGYDYHKQRHHSRPYYRPVQKKKVIKRYDDGDDDNLLIGLLIGGLVGYAISQNTRTETVHYDRYPVTHYAE